MFTGHVETVGIISRLEEVNQGAQIEIYAPEFGRDLALGDTVCVDGVGLAIAAFERGAFVADISSRDLDTTTLDTLRVEDRVNLERALRLSDRVNGRMTLGHVDGRGWLVQRHVSGNSTVYQFELPEAIAALVVEGGPIVINGVALTIARMNGVMIACHVPPIVEARTTLPILELNSEVNIEVDLIAKYVARLTGEYFSEH